MGGGEGQEGRRPGLLRYAQQGIPVATRMGTQARRDEGDEAVVMTCGLSHR